MSPGAVTERVHFFVAEYDSSMRILKGGGLANEGEDIEVLELDFDEVLRIPSTIRRCARKPTKVSYTLIRSRASRSRPSSGEPTRRRNHSSIDCGLCTRRPNRNRLSGKDFGPIARTLDGQGLHPMEIISSDGNYWELATMKLAPLIFTYTVLLMLVLHVILAETWTEVGLWIAVVLICAQLIASRIGSRANN